MDVDVDVDGDIGISYFIILPKVSVVVKNKDEANLDRGLRPIRTQFFFYFY